MNPTINKKMALGLVLVLVLSGAAQAASFIATTNDDNPKPLVWDMSNGPIPAYTDGGGAFTYDFDGVTPFITIERANEITQFGLDQWTQVETSTFAGNVVGTIEGMTGVADVTAENVLDFLGVQNGYGMWMIYDTDASILTEVLGVSKFAVLGITALEFADQYGHLLETSTILNGWYVDAKDTNGDWVAGVFTHELGHATNLGHSQVNGHMAYYSTTSTPKYPGVGGCDVDPVYRWNYPPSVGETADPYEIETMYPIIGSRNITGQAMSYVSTRDDIAAISNLYPTADYLSSTGTITGTLYLKDHKTEYTGINIVARNVNDRTGDAIAGQTGQATLGRLGPDGTYTIHGLTPGEQYVLSMEDHYTGAFTPAAADLVSVPEYWNADEDNLPTVDDPCDQTPILAEAGVTATADFYFNGYVKGIDYTPIGPFFLTDLAKNGASALGQAGATPFLWDEKKGIVLMPGAVGTSGAINRNGNVVATSADHDDNGIISAGLWTTRGFEPFGFLGETECGGSATGGVYSSTPWAISDDGGTTVGLAYWDKDGDGTCQKQYLPDPEIVAFIWTKEGGLRALPTDGFPRTPAFFRAHGISGNGRVVLGGESTSRAVAWVDEGPVIDLYGMVGATEAYAASYDGTRVALRTNTTDGVVLWNPFIEGEDAFQAIGGLTWCVDMDYILSGRNFCDLLGPEVVQSLLGPIQVSVWDMTDDGTVMVGRAGEFRAGFIGAIWMEPIGWMNFRDFFAKQGVIEAQTLPMDNPYSIDANGTTMAGGLAGASYTWLVKMDQVYVCEDGVSVQTGFPNGLFNKIAEGAEFGRCEHLSKFAPGLPSDGERRRSARNTDNVNGVHGDKLRFGLRADPLK